MGITGYERDHYANVGRVAAALERLADSQEKLVEVALTMSAALNVIADASVESELDEYEQTGDERPREPIEEHEIEPRDFGSEQ